MYSQNDKNMEHFYFRNEHAPKVNVLIFSICPNKVVLERKKKIKFDHSFVFSCFSSRAFFLPLPPQNPIDYYTPHTRWCGPPVNDSY